jgi:hypothetical protein
MMAQEKIVVGGTERIVRSDGVRDIHGVQEQGGSHILTPLG